MQARPASATCELEEWGEGKTDHTDWGTQLCHDYTAREMDKRGLKMVGVGVGGGQNLSKRGGT